MALEELSGRAKPIKHDVLPSGRRGALEKERASVRLVAL